MSNNTKKTKNLDGVIPAHWMKAFDESTKDGLKLSPAQRVKIIEKAFKDILCREPDTRDLNHYKYSSATEEEIREELLDSKEHKTLIENGRDYQKLKNLLEDSNSQIRALERHIKDKEANLKDMDLLLKEKNLHIKELREKEEKLFEDT